MNGYTPRQIAQALRSQPMQAGGGQLGQPRTSSPISVASAEYDPSGGVSEGMQDAAKAAGTWAKENYFTDNSGADGIAQASAAQAYGPEVAKMGGAFAPTQAATTNGGFGGMFDDASKALGGMGGGLEVGLDLAKKYGGSGLGMLSSWFK